MKYAKITDRGALIAPIPISNAEAVIEAVVADGFIPLEEADMPDETLLGVIESYKCKYRQGEGCIVEYYEKVEVDIKKVVIEIDRLKVELAASDYKVTKNQELQMMGLACEYDPDELHAQREQLREAIRELEVYLG